MNLLTPKGDADTARISITALYTGHIWFKNDLSLPVFHSYAGRILYWMLKPVNVLLRLMAGADIETFLLERHRVIDERVTALVEQHPSLQIIELACGLSPRGARIMAASRAGVNYIETDLPGMAQRKKSMLAKLGLLNDKHTVQPCNILKVEGEESVEAIINRLDRRRPVLIITEGLVNYFDLPTITAFWQRIATATKSFPNSYYITEVYPDLKGHPRYDWIQRASKLVATLTRSDYPLHYETDQEMQQGFQGCGFETVEIVNPSKPAPSKISPSQQPSHHAEPKPESAVRIVVCENQHFVNEQAAAPQPGAQ